MDLPFSTSVFSIRLELSKLLSHRGRTGDVPDRVLAHSSLDRSAIGKVLAGPSQPPCAAKSERRTFLTGEHLAGRVVRQ
jgi:hypothetical protein